MTASNKGENYLQFANNLGRTSLTVEHIANFSKYRGVIEYKPDVSTQSIQREVELTERDKGHAQSNLLCHAWKDFLGSTGPYAYFWTLSFQHPYSDGIAVDALWNCTRYINRSLWGARWHRKGVGLTATVIAERHSVSLELRGRLHFHVLVHPPAGVNVELERFTAAANDGSIWLKDSFGRSMSTTDRIDVRAVNDIDGLASYLAKDLETAYWGTGENVFFIRPQGLEGVAFRMRTGSELRRQQ